VLSPLFVIPPLIMKLAPGAIIKLAPADMVCAVFSTQLSPTAGLTYILSPEGKIDGGMALLLQLAGIVQLPLPVKV